MKRATLLAAALAAMAPPASAQYETEAQQRDDAAFGSQRFPREAAGDRPILLDVEIDRSDANFWRGQLDGRGDNIELTARPDHICAQIIVGYYVPPPSPADLNSSEPAKLRVKVDYDYGRRSNRFQLSFTYERNMPAVGPSGQDCDLGNDRRTIEQSFGFAIDPGQTVTMPDYLGFQVKVTRR